MKICDHFPKCGGCQIMDLDDGAQRALKTSDFIGAMNAMGVEIGDYDYHVSPLYSRRRATLTGRRTKKSAQLGFLAAASHEIVDQHMCLILTEAIFGLRPALLEMTPILASRNAMLKFHITQVDNGFDLVVENAKELPADKLAILAQIAGEAQIVRLMMGQDIIFQTDTPFVDMAGIRVELPPHPFLQATRDGEAILRHNVHNFMRGQKRLADLFAGLGTFSYGFDGEIDAYEGGRSMITQLNHNAKGNVLNGLRGIERDLFRDPLVAKELAAYDGVIIDPPRHGAESQARGLAHSSVSRIAFVSCNAQSFARDARILIDGGYKMQELALVDQFRLAKHLESVALFVKNA